MEIVLKARVESLKLFVPVYLKTKKQAFGYDKLFLNYRYYQKSFLSR